jgi:hypothetical protein
MFGKQEVNMDDTDMTEEIEIPPERSGDRCTITKVPRYENPEEIRQRRATFKDA